MRVRELAFLKPEKEMHHQSDISGHGRIYEADDWSARFFRSFKQFRDCSDIDFPDVPVKDIDVGKDERAIKHDAGLIMLFHKLHNAVAFQGKAARINVFAAKGIHTCRFEFIWCDDLGLGILFIIAVVSMPVEDL